MNYYERHLGDYARDTGHLTMLEHGAYTLLMDRYYATEKPIPKDQAHRICRARSQEEIAAVDAVLTEFFVLSDGLYKQGRIDAEIENAAARINAARSNGRTGGRPRKKPDGLSTETHKKPTGLSVGSENETQHEPSRKLSNLQSPISNLQSPEREEAAPSGAELVPRETFSGWKFIDSRMRPNYPRGMYLGRSWINASKLLERQLSDGAVSESDLGLIEAGCQRYLSQCEAEHKPPKFVFSPERFLAEFLWREEFPLPTDPVQQAAADKLAATWARIRTHATAIGCPLAERKNEPPECFETRVKTWERENVRAPAATSRFIDVAALAAQKTVGAAQ